MPRSASAIGRTHDTDVIPTEALGKDQQGEIVGRIRKALKSNGLQCSMVTTETFYHAVWAASPAAESPEVRDYAAFRVRNTVEIGHELGAQVRGLLAGIARLLRAGRDRRDADAALVCRMRSMPPASTISRWRKRKGRPTLKHCLEAKPFEPQAEILLPTSDAMLAFIASGLLTHPEMVGLESGVPARADVGSGAAGRAGARACWRASCGTSTSTTATG